MPQLSIIQNHNASFSFKKNGNIRSFFSKDSITSAAKKLRLWKRERKLNYAQVVVPSVSILSSRVKHHLLTLNSVRVKLKKDFGVDVSSKCFHNYIDKDSMKEFGADLCAKALSVVTAKVNKYHKNHKDQCTLKKLAEKLGVDDIILIGGTEITVRNGSIKNFDCKGKGRKRIDSSDTKPGLKLHVAFSLLKQNIEYIHITQACDSERA